MDACIGSGKTTAIQSLCNELPSNKKVLYMTYNKLLKKSGVSVGISDLIQTFIRPSIGKYDIAFISDRKIPVDKAQKK